MCIRDSHQTERKLGKDYTATRTLGLLQYDIVVLIITIIFYTESKNLHQISSYLHELPNDVLIYLGLALGLSYSKLKRLESSRTFLLDMLSMWLREEDNVIKVGPPTWRTLVKALREETIMQTGIAQTIESNHLA